MVNQLLQSVLLSLESGKQKSIIAFVEDVVAFMCNEKNNSVLDDWEPEALRQLVAYHLAKGTLIVSSDGEGNIAGVLMWYRCNDTDDWSMITEWKEDRTQYNALFLAFLYADSKKAFQEMARRVMQMEPEWESKSLIGLRAKNGNQPTRMDYPKTLFKKILQLK